MRITLRDYQKECLEKSLKVRNVLWCMKVGTGKTITATFLSRILLNNKKIDKVIFCITVSGINAFNNTFKDVGVDIKLVEKVEDLIEFLKSKDKFILVKHSMMEELGKNKGIVDKIEDILEKDYKKLMLVIDEAHKFSNTESWLSFGVENTRKFFEKIMIMTATPYSSTLTQIYGLVKLIYPNKWKDVKEFKNKYVKTKIIKDWKGKFLRTEEVAYINLPQLREELLPFTYFYYPPTQINYIYHKINLAKEKYKEYVELCKSTYEELKLRSIKDKDKKEDGKDLNYD